MKFLTLALTFLSLSVQAQAWKRDYTAHSVGLNTEKPVRFQLSQKIKADMCNSYGPDSDEFVTVGSQPGNLRYIYDAGISQTEMDCEDRGARTITVKSEILEVQPWGSSLDFTLYAPKEWTLTILE